MEKFAFKIEKPIIGMVHLRYWGNVKTFEEEAKRDIKSLSEGGVDGLLFENWGGILQEENIRQHMEKVINRSMRGVHLPFGINVLPINYQAAFDIADETNADFVQMDTLVDLLGTEGGKILLEVNPIDVIKRRNLMKNKKMALYANIQSKHYVTFPQGKPLQKSATDAVRYGADAIVVTGPVTGISPTAERLKTVKQAVKNTPVLIGSGFDAQNARGLLPHADGVIVGTSIKEYGNTDSPVDQARVIQLMRTVSMLRV
jgi:membrane complex biogenesis BtpA family protein